MRILGIETSCDETSAAVVENGTVLLSNVITSSLEMHSQTGGIIPENAARAQVKYIIPIIEKVLKESSLYPPSSIRQLADQHLSSSFYRPDVDAVAITVGPGLIGSLLVGVETAKTLSYVWDKPLIPVNHLIGHIYANFINKDSLSSLRSRMKRERSNLNKLNARRHTLDAKIKFPALTLVVSGGHTDLVLMKKHGSIKWLGGTRDDAAGEAFDKIGRILGLPYPGGPAIEQAAQQGNLKAFHFPRPMINTQDFDFSFSGLKTAVLREVKKLKEEKQFNNLAIQQLAYAVQEAITDVLVKKTLDAALQHKAKSILLAGGVSANQKLRDEFELNARRHTLDAKIFAPQKSLCTDNAAMIASAAYFNYHPQPLSQITANPELYFA